MECNIKNGLKRVTAVLLSLSLLIPGCIVYAANENESDDGGGIIMNPVWSEYDKQSFEGARTTNDALNIFHNTFASTLPSALQPGSNGIADLILYSSLQFAQINAVKKLRKDPITDEFYNGVQYYNQGNYPDIPYSRDYDNGDSTKPATVANSGCGITCFSMLLSYYLQDEYPPSYTAYVANVHGLDTVLRWSDFRELARLFNLEFDGIYYGPQSESGLVPSDSAKEACLRRIDRALDNGDLVIASMSPNHTTAPEDEKDFWTSGGHYVLIVGRTYDGRYLINDPASHNKTMGGPYEARYITDYTKGQIIIKNPHLEYLNQEAGR